MSTGLSKYGAKKAIRTEMKRFETTSILTAKTDDGTWVLYGPVADIVGESLASASLYNKRIVILVDVGGKEVPMEFVSRAHFLGVSLISERYPRFLEFVVGLLEELEDKGVAIDPTYAMDPQVQFAKSYLQTQIDVAKIKQKTAELEARTDENEKQIDIAAKKAQLALNTAIAEANCFMLVPWAASQGIMLNPDGDGKDEGVLLAKACRARRIEPRKQRTPRYPDGVNIYPEEMLLLWKEDYLKRHPIPPARLNGR